MRYPEAVAKRTKDLLFKNNISQYRLIKETCLTKTAIQKMFKNKTKDVKLSTIRVIADFFNMSLKEFFDDEMFNSENLDLD